MNAHAKTKPAVAAAALIKADPALPALIVTAADSIAIRAGTVFNGVSFAEETPVAQPAEGYRPGSDYAVIVAAAPPAAVKVTSIPDGEHVLGGFHFAPGGNAPARAGGNEDAAVNPFSLWDVNFRPACPDPRGMALINGRFWCDIYLTGANHLKDGTSHFGVTIADGDDLPQSPDPASYKRFDYATARAVMAHHGKGLLSLEEFFVAAYGVTEKTATNKDPRRTGLDAPRTSKWGLMQATGNLWVWGHDGDPDEPRASLFGGGWWNDDSAGSRYADVDYWPGYSGVSLGARGRSDHLQPG